MEQKTKKGSVPLSLSLYDLDHCLKDAGLTFSELPSDKQAEILFYLGMDTRSDIEWYSCIHRTKFKPNNEPYEGYLITGVERVDDEWFWSGKASLDNRIARHSKSGMSYELRIMSATSTFTADICDHVKEKKDKK